MSHHSIMSYMLWTSKSFTDKIHLTLFSTYNSVSAIYTSHVYLLLKSPTCVIQHTLLDFFFPNLFICLTIIIEGIDMESSIILSELKLELPSIPLI